MTLQCERRTFVPRACERHKVAAAESSTDAWAKQRRMLDA